MFRAGGSKVWYPAIWKRDPETGEPAHTYRECIPGEQGDYEVMVVHDQKKEEWYCEVWRNADQSALRIKMETLWMAHIGDNMMDRVIEGIEREEKANE